MTFVQRISATLLASAIFLCGCRRQVCSDDRSLFITFQMTPEQVASLPHVLHIETTEPRSDVKQILETELRKYPFESLKNLQLQVIACDVIQIDAVSVSGTYWHHMVFVKIPIDPWMDLDLEIARTLHHELSSVVLWSDGERKRRLEAAWLACNPVGFEYIGKALEAAARRDTDLVALDNDYAQQGFCNEYSFQSIEEDLNTITSLIMTRSKFIWQRYEAYGHDSLTKKVNLVLGLYGEVFGQEFISQFSVR